MPIPRDLIERLALLTTEAVIDELERAKKEGRPPHHAAMGAGIKLLSGIEVARGEPPIVEPPSAPSTASRPLSRRTLDLVKDYMTPEEKAALDVPLPAVDDSSDF